MSKAGFDTLVKVLKIGLGISILCFLIFSVNVSSIADTLKDVNIYFFILSLIFAFLIIIFLALRQKCFLHNISMTAMDAIRVQFSATFVSNFLPGGVGGDVYKVYVYKRNKSTFRDGTVSIAIDKMFGFFTLLTFGILSLISKPELVVGQIRGMTVEILILILTCIWFAYVVALYFWVQSWKQKEDSVNGLDWRHIVAICCLVYLVQMAKFFCLGAMIGVDLSPVVIAQVLLVHQFSAFLPFTIGGLGITEGSIMLMLGLFGVPSTEAVIIALGNRATIIMISSIGYIFWLKSYRTRL